MTRWPRSRALLLAAAVLCATACFPREAGPRLRHFEELAPRSGATAPPLRLYDLQGRPLGLATVLDGRPAVVRFGSRSCPVYRYRRFGMARLQEELGDRVAWIVVYTREAHPAGAPSPYAEGEEWVPWINRLTRTLPPEHADLEARLAEARRSRATLTEEVVMLVDPMDDRGWARYGRAPSPAFVLDRDGRVVLRQVWTDPAEIGRVLRRMLDGAAGD